MELHCVKNATKFQGRNWEVDKINFMPTRTQVKNWKDKGWSFQKIGNKFGMTRQRMHQIYYSEELKIIREERKKAEQEIRSPAYYITRHRYYCRSCEQFFWSKLGVKDAICTKCGSSKII